MLNKNREIILKVAAGAVIGLFVLDRLVLTPALGAWKSQSERLADLTKKVERGRQLLEHGPHRRGDAAQANESGAISIKLGECREVPVHQQVSDLLDGRRVGVLGFTEFRNSAFVPLVERGLESFDLEYDVLAFNERLPRVRIIPIAEFDPAQFL